MVGCVQRKHGQCASSCQAMQAEPKQVVVCLLVGSRHWREVRVFGSRVVAHFQPLTYKHAQPCIGCSLMHGF